LLASGHNANGSDARHFFADDVILAIENATLRDKATSAADRPKTKSRKGMSKARVISVEDASVLRLRHQVEKKDRILVERKAKAAQRWATKATKATPKRKQVTINLSPEVIVLETLNLGSDSEPKWLDSGSDTRYHGARQRVTQPQPRRITRTQHQETS